MSIEHTLDSDIYTNKIEYFFTLLGPRFDLAVQLMEKSLEKHFGKKFKAIYVYSASPNEYFEKDNYIVLNAKALQVEDDLKTRTILLPEYEDINTEFSQSPFIQTIAKKLLKKQKGIFVYPFTSSFLKLCPSFKVIGANGDIVTYYDNKINQYYLFKKLGLPVNEAHIFKTKNSLIKNWKKGLPCYLTAAYTSGGNESGLIFSREMLEKFLAGLRGVNLKQSFMSARIFRNIVLAPNVNAIVIGKNQTKPLVITDQILRGNRYLGNIYPSKATTEIQKEIIDITTKVGDYLSIKGFRGLFGLDFLLNKDGKLVTVDLNPRRQGGYVCNIAALAKCEVNLTDLELKACLNEPIKENLSLDRLVCPNAWAHSKIKPHDVGGVISNEISHGDINKIFEEGQGDYYSSFYAKDSIFIDGYIGYSVSVGQSYNQVFENATLNANKVLGEVLFL